MGKGRSITVSAPAKIHLLGEHAVVYGKPALLAAMDLRVQVTVSQGRTVVYEHHRLQKIVERVVKRQLRLKGIPLYSLEISSQIPAGAGLGSSAAISAAYIAALLTYLRVELNLELINKLAYEAEKVFHGNPSGADNSTAVYGGLIWYRKEAEEVKLIQPLPFSLPRKLAKNFVLINTGQPKETTREMVEIVSAKFKVQSAKFKKLFDSQEQLVKELLLAMQHANEKELIRILRTGEANLESIGVVSKQVAALIRAIEKTGGAAKICGGGSKSGPTGILLCYHPTPSIITQLAKSHHLDYFKTTLGVKGLRRE